MSQPAQPHAGLGAWLDTDAAAADESPLRFPCAFPIKAMGRAEHDIAALVLAIVRRHAPALGDDALTTRPSSGGKWLAVTVVVQAESRAQLDAIYQDLTGHAQIAYVL